jgi:hypothetical protein
VLTTLSHEDHEGHEELGASATRGTAWHSVSAFGFSASPAISALKRLRVLRVKKTSEDRGR